MYRHQYMLNYQQFPSSSSCGVSNSIASSFDDCSMQNVPETHKSMWVLNPLYASTSGKKTVMNVSWPLKNRNCKIYKFISAFSECEANYRTNSLPAWGKLKQRPVTINDDIANLYVKVCFIDHSHSIPFKYPYFIIIFSLIFSILDEFKQEAT